MKLPSGELSILAIRGYVHSTRWCTLSTFLNSSLCRAFYTSGQTKAVIAPHRLCLDMACKQALLLAILLAVVSAQTGRHRILKNSIGIRNPGEEVDGPSEGARKLAAAGTRVGVFSGVVCAYGVDSTSQPLPSSPGGASSAAECWRACDVDLNCNFFFYSLIAGTCKLYTAVAGTLVPATGTDYRAYDASTVCETNGVSSFPQPTKAPSRNPTVAPTTSPSTATTNGPPATNTPAPTQVNGG